MNAWIAATINSKKNINIEKAKETIENPYPAAGFWPILLKIKMREIILNIIICPAKILANKRIANAIGLINKDMISIGTNKNLIGNGTPGGFNKCPQKCLLALISKTINEIKAKQAVTVMLPVKLAPPGNKPNILLIQIKKNKVNNNGIYF